MSLRKHNAEMWRRVGAGLVAAMLAAAQSVPLRAQKATPSAPSAPPAAPPATLPGAGQGTVLDRVVAVVNGDLILESDVDEEGRFEEIQPYRTTDESHSREATVRRLIDRLLILQQAELEPETSISDKALDAQLMTLRRDIPECRQYHCETEAGWEKYINAHGFTLEEFRKRWRERMELLRFIEVRFRNGIQVSDDDIKNYYEKTMLPEYAERHVTPPKLEAITPRIEEVLLQQQVGNLLRDWLTSLRAQGRVRIMGPDEVAP
jgi:parvulin-like peptidyl-prolyl isomerase